MKFLRVCMSIEPRDVVDVPCDVFEVNDEDNSVSVFYDGELYGFFSGPEYSYIIDEDVFSEREIEQPEEPEEADEVEESDEVEIVPAAVSLNGSYTVEAAPDDISELESAPEAVEEPDADSR